MPQLMHKLFRRGKYKRKTAEDEDYTLETREDSPSHLLTTIKSFSKLSVCKSLELESTEFEAGDYKWKVIIYPNGDKVGRKASNISVCLSMVGTSSLPAGWDVTAMFNFFLYNHNSDNYLCFRGKARRFHALNSEWGFSKVINKFVFAKPSSGFVVNDSCVFGAEVFVVKKQPIMENLSLYRALDLPIFVHEWKVSEFSKHENGLSSEEFFAGGCKWKIVLYPNGTSSARGRYVSVYLECVDSASLPPRRKGHASFDFILRNKLSCFSSHSHSVTRWFTSTEGAWGFDEFIQVSSVRDPRKGFVVDDCCLFVIKLQFYALSEAA